jgi:acetate kinase
MPSTNSGHILTLNGGSSSIKFALFGPGESHDRLLAGSIDRIGLPETTLTIKVGNDQPSDRQRIEAPDHDRAISHLLERLKKKGHLEPVSAVGHRIVHGGPHYKEPQRITPDIVNELRRLIPIDPAHLPGEIALIEAVSKQHPNLPQVACFDTAFHQTMPRVAKLLPIQRKYDAEGVQRFGFHGLSYAYLLEELAHVAGPDAAKGRVILAHLGNGASLAAVKEGKSIDTSMSFTPTAGIVMGTRCGDLDPGVLVYIMRRDKLSADQVDDLVNKQSGLLGISETSFDMRDLLARQSSDVRAAEAVSAFCYTAKKWIGAFAAALGGLDTLVFSGGIGEHAAEVRARIVEDFEFLGVHVDQALNERHADVISSPQSRVCVRVIKTDEEKMIARLTRGVVIT